MTANELCGADSDALLKLIYALWLPTPILLFTLAGWPVGVVDTISHPAITRSLPSYKILQRSQSKKYWVLK